MNRAGPAANARPEPDAALPGQNDGWSGLYAHALDRLGDRHEARWLVEEASDSTWAEIVGSHPDVTVRARTYLMEMVERRAGGEPLQYVLGSWSFRSLDLMVDPRVLIPRPETEQVVEVALAELDRVRDRRGRTPPVAAIGLTARSPQDSRPDIVVDLGTGSGAIALSVVSERTGVEVWATDRSPNALDVARSNLAGLGGFAATRVRMVEGDWWGALPEQIRGRVDLVVSNPPYISSAEMTALDPGVVGWEPRSALEAGPRGLEAVSEILIGAKTGDWLAPGATIVIEIAPHRAGAAMEIAVAHGFARELVHTRPDLAGRERALVVRT